MKIFATLSLLSLAITAFAQNVSLTVFNNGGQQFFVVMNGIRQNSLPLTNIRISGMTTGSYEVKLIFADGKTGDINKKLYLGEPGDYLSRVRFKGKKGKLMYFGVSNEGNAGGTSIQYRPNDQSVYSDQTTSLSGNGQGTFSGQQPSGTFSGNGSAPSGNGSATLNGGTTSTNPTMNNGQTNMGTSVSGTPNGGTQNGSGTLNVGTTVTDPNMNNGQLNMGTSVSGTPNGTGNTGMNMGTTVTDPNLNNGQFGMNISINVADPAMGGTGTETINMGTTITDPTMNNGQFGMGVNMSGTGITSSTATTTTSSSTTVTQNGQVVQDSHNWNQTTSVTQNGQTTTTSQSSQSGMPNGSGQVTMNSNMGTNGMGGTVTPVNSGYTCTTVLVNTADFVKRIQAENFDADKREIIEKELKNQCVSSDQAYQIIKELTFAADRLDMSKYLYDRMTDRVNGSKLIALLEFEMDQEEYTTYMRTRP